MSLLDHPPPGLPPDPPGLLYEPDTATPWATAAMSTADVGLSTDDELLDEAATLERIQRRIDARRMALYGEISARSITERRHGLSLKAWLGHEHRVSGSTAARQVATAKKLRLLLPEVAGALAEGAITFDHAAMIARLCTPRVEAIVVDLQEVLIELARVTKFDRWAHDVRGLISLADQDGPRPMGEPKNRLRIIDGLDGSLRIEAELHGATASQVRAALIEEAQRRYRAHTRKAHGHDGQDGPGEAGETAGVEGDTSTDAGTGTATDSDDSEQGPEHGPQHGRCCEADLGLNEFPQRGELMAEALAELISRGCGARPNAPSPVTDVTLVVHASGPLDARTPDGVRLQDGTIRELLCDAVFRAVVVDQLGVPIDQGRAARLYSSEQRRNIKVRDGSCGHPGCDVPWEWLQIHHVEEWDHDGPTDQTNGLPACGLHHRLWHSDGWSVAPDPDTHHLDEGFIISTPDGRTLRSQRHGSPRLLVTELGLDN